jgi:hypothetical protein
VSSTQPPCAGPLDDARREPHDHDCRVCCRRGSRRPHRRQLVHGLDEVLPGIGFHFPGPVALAVAGAAVVLGVTAAIIPARRAARLKVITALTYE